MDTVELIGLLAPVTYFVFLLAERLWPAREFPPRKGWQWIGVAFADVRVTLSTSSVPVMRTPARAASRPGCPGRIAER